MGLIQYLIQGVENLTHKEFEIATGILNNGFKTVIPDYSQGFYSFYESIKKQVELEFLGISIVKTNYNLVSYFTDNFLYIELPDFENRKDNIKFFRNEYLRNISNLYLMPDNIEVNNEINELKTTYAHLLEYRFNPDKFKNSKMGFFAEQHAKTRRGKDCVNSINFSLSEEKEFKIEKIMSKDGLCINCMERFPEEIKQKYLYGII